MDGLWTLNFDLIIGTHMLLTQSTKEICCHASGVYRIHLKLCCPVGDKYPVSDRNFVGQCDDRVLTYNDIFKTV